MATNERQVKNNAPKKGPESLMIETKGPLKFSPNYKHLDCFISAPKKLNYVNEIKCILITSVCVDKFDRHSL